MLHTKPKCCFWGYFISLQLLFQMHSVAFQYPITQYVSARRHKFIKAVLNLAESNDAEPTRVAVPSAELDDTMGLTPEERTVVNIHRTCSPSVVYITSVLKPPSSNSIYEQRERKPSSGDRKLPRGTALGSGSGFVIDVSSDGNSYYVITNYHVIQRAYEANQMMINYETFWNNLGKNFTDKLNDVTGNVAGDSLEGIVNRTLDIILRDGRSQEDDGRNDSDDLPAQVFVRFGTDGDDSAGGGRASYFPCEIVDVVKELDAAVLRIDAPTKSDSSGERLPVARALSYGQSSDLLVGQKLVAIGNPFGLDRTITSGVVSALGRSVTGVAGNPIKNCIQTDASINPGNSGGPLFNMKGEVVGVNTMIISTSGSSAGIGFAVPGDSVRDNTESIIEMDKERKNRSMKRKGRGWLGVDVALGSLELSLRKRVMSKDEDEGIGAFITSISPGSPVYTADISKTTLSNGNIQLGDRVVSVGGNQISSGSDLVNDLKGRVEGEQLTLTVENVEGDRRVVYVTCGKVPM